ncbi:MAG: magnesium transporter [SAR324 cluster bacterium]|nr:magnesium transporter [SAR324 cluster bacterium]
MNKLTMQLAQAFLETHPSEAAKVLETLAPKVNASLLQKQSPEQSRAILRGMLPLDAARSLEAMESSLAGAIISGWRPRQATRCCRHFQPKTFASLLPFIPKKRAALLKRLLKYPENTAGALMDPNAFVFRRNSSVKRAWEQIRKHPQSTFYYLYVIDTHHKLIGVLNLRELAEAEPEKKLSTLMNTEVDHLFDHASQQEILVHPGWRKFHALPVVDDQEVFLGVIRYASLRLLEEQEEQSTGRASIEAGSALGELYGIGLSMILGGAGMNKAAQPLIKSKEGT